MDELKRKPRWEQIDNPVVPCRGVGEMRSYLLHVLPRWYRLPVARVKICLACGKAYADFETPEGILRSFVGYLGDLAYNIQRGYYEQPDIV